MYTNCIQERDENMLNDEMIKTIVERNKTSKKRLSKNEIKKEYIDSFGIEKWKEEEMLEKLIALSFKISSFLGIEALPIIFENIEPEDSRLYVKEEYIAISEKHKQNYIECAKCLCHELRHVYQLFYTKLSDSPKALRMKNEFISPIILDTNSQESIIQYMMQEIEIDACAFTKWYLKRYLNINITHPMREYEGIIKEYIIKYFN